MPTSPIADLDSFFLCGRTAAKKNSVRSSVYGTHEQVLTGPSRWAAPLQGPEVERGLPPVVVQCSARGLAPAVSLRRQGGGLSPRRI